MTHSPSDKAPAASGGGPVEGADPRDGIAALIPDLRAFGIALTRSPSTADDLVQETIVKAWTNIDKYRPGTNLKAWMFTILRNTYFSQRRKQSREVSDPDGFHAAKLAESPAHDGRLAFGEFLRAFDQLSAEHREVLILVGANDYSYEEAAGMIGVAVGTVKSRANRARARLAELMELSGSTEDLLRPSQATLAVVLRTDHFGP